MASSTTIVNPTIFREYIGSKQYPDNLHDFPNIIDPRVNEFHFIIAFASEQYNESGRGTGKFCRNWIVPPIDQEMIQRLKNSYENVKVVISIGGRGPEYPFNPVEVETWFGNARDSLNAIINGFKDPSGNNLIDGIDIFYDHIIVNRDDFAKYIGRLIKSLKKAVNVVSIAPSGPVEGHYRALFLAHGSDIDWVNYQFYTDKITRAVDFEGKYRNLANIYTGHKLLAGFSTDPADADNLPPLVFLEACEDLIRSKELPGIFIWNTNDSQMARRSQSLLAQN